MRANHRISVTTIGITAAIFLVALSMLAPRCVDAHAFPASEQPSAGSTLKSSPAAVEIHFDNPVEAMFARLHVRDKSGADVTSGAPAVSRDGLTLSVKLKPLASGDYIVKWSVVAEDSHRSEGSYTFTVTGSAN
jgi:methionine-rich copper-binding protein CopC